MRNPKKVVPITSKLLSEQDDYHSQPACRIAYCKINPNILVDQDEIGCDIRIVGEVRFCVVLNLENKTYERMTSSGQPSNGRLELNELDWIVITELLKHQVSFLL